MRGALFMTKRIFTFLSYFVFFILAISIFSMEVKADSNQQLVSIDKLNDTVNAMSDKSAKSFKSFYEKVEELDKQIEDNTITCTRIIFKKGVAQEDLSFSGKGFNYYGELKNGYPNGFGKVVIDTYDAYYATFSNGKVSGYAMSVYYSNTDAGIEGYAADNCSIAKGSSGELEVTGNGIIFGYINDNYYDKKIAGKNYLSYEGKLKKAQKDGSGTLFYTDGNILYKGNFKNNDYSGTGKLYFRDGTLQYEGNFKYGYYNGKGTLYNEDGSVKHKGKFKHGQIS